MKIFRFLLLPALFCLGFAGGLQSQVAGRQPARATLAAVMKTNADLIKRQEATLARLQQIEAEAQQIKAFAKRG
jgi:hypothetical protein